MTHRHNASAGPTERPAGGPSAPAAAVERPLRTAVRAARWLLLLMGVSIVVTKLGLGVIGEVLLGVAFLACAGALIVQHYRKRRA